MGATRTNWKAKYEATQAKYDDYKRRIADTDPECMTLAALCNIVDRRGDAIHKAIDLIQTDLPEAVKVLRAALTWNGKTK